MKTYREWLRQAQITGIEEDRTTPLTQELNQRAKEAKERLEAMREVGLIARREAAFSANLLTGIGRRLAD